MNPNKKKKLTIILLAVVILFLILYLKGTPEDKSNIIKATDQYLSKLAIQLRTNGVTSIEASSREININWFYATAKIKAVFNIYNPATKDTSKYEDTITFKLSKTGAGWEVKEVKYEKTKW